MWGNSNSTKMPLPEIVSVERCVMCYHMVYEIQVKSPNMKKSALKNRSFGLSFEMKIKKWLEKLKIGQYAIMQKQQKQRRKDGKCRNILN